MMMLTSWLSQIDKTRSKQLITGIIAIYATYLIAAVLNQKIIKYPYIVRQFHRLSKSQSQTAISQPEYLNSTLGFIFLTAAIPWVIGSLINKINIPIDKKTVIPNKNALMCAIITLFSSFTFITAIQFTNFPIAAFFKSCNLLSVVLVGLCTKKQTKKLQNKKILIAAIISLGLIIFSIYNPETNSQLNATQVVGIVLLVISIFADGLLPGFQAEIKAKFNPNPMQLMTENNKWVCLLSFGILALTNKVPHLFNFCLNHIDFLIEIILMGVLITLGEAFVYQLGTQFKRQIVPFILTIRKITTVVISLIYFSHQCSIQQVLAIVCILSIVIYDFITQLKNSTEGEHSQFENPVTSKQQFAVFQQDEIKPEENSAEKIQNPVDLNETTQNSIMVVEKEENQQTGEN